MQQLFENSFFMALGKAIAASIWQMGVLFLVYQFIVLFFKLKQAAYRNLLSTIFTLGGFIWFAVTIVQYLNKSTPAALVFENTAAHQHLIEQFTDSNQWQLLLNWAEYKFNLLLPYLSIAYLVVLIWFALRLCVQLLQTNALRTKGTFPAQHELQYLITALAQHLNLQKNVLVFISNRIDIPATIGFLKPVILLPAAALTHLTPAQLEAVLLHELAHIQRNDYFWNLLLSITETLLFFNPFALLLIGIARKERENSCDDIVMRYRQNAAVYAEALLTVEKARILTPQLAMALGDNKHQLMHRVKRILNLPAEKNKFSVRILALLFFTVLFALMGWVLQNKQQTKKAENTTVNSSFKEGKPLLIKTNAYVEKVNKILSVKDQSGNLNVKIKKTDQTKEYILLNDNGEEFKFDKIIFESLPGEWIEGIEPEKTNVTILSDIDDAKIQKLLLKDSVRYNQHRKQYKVIQEQYVRGERDNRIIRMQNPGSPYMFYFNGKPFTDSAFEFYFRPPHPFNFEWKEKMAIAEEEKEKEKMTDKMKQNQKRMLQLAELRRKARALETSRLKSFDSVYTEKKYLFENTPSEWLALIEKPFAEMQQHSTVTIIIEENKVFINGKPIVTDSIIQQAPKRKLLKAIDIMKL